jgi:hypothetical protein
MRIVLALALAGCACPTPPVKPVAGAGSAPQTASACEAARAHVAELYRTEAGAKEPGRADEATADNVAMALADCAKDPGTRAACLAAAQSVADIEHKCVAPLDDDGTEGTSL